MKKILLLSFIFVIPCSSSALVINEVMSNPTGTDDGREWVEVYNNESQSIDISQVTISIKGGTPVVLTSVQGGTVIPAGGYLIIGSTISSQTKFLQDYPSYTGVLTRASMSLVNTGVTSLDIRIQGAVVDSLPSYTAAKEGSSFSKINGTWLTSVPSPGAENIQSQSIEETAPTSLVTSNTSSQNQVTISQMSPPSPDIVLYVPSEKVVIAGADTEFSVSGMTKSGKQLESMSYTWAFGDGGRGTGSSTLYRYVYPGRYVVQVEGGNSSVIGVATIRVRVVPPDIIISSVGIGSRGAYVDIRNPNPYDLELSQWKLIIDGASYVFPKHTILGNNETTRFSGAAMGFASSTFTSTSKVSINFPTNEEVASYAFATTSKQPLFAERVTVPNKVKQVVPGKSLIMSGGRPTNKGTSTVLTYKQEVKQKNITNFFKSIFE